MKIRETFLNLMGALVAIFVVISFMIGNEVMMVISIAIPLVLMLIVSVFAAYLMLTQMLNSISKINSWSYTYDVKYHGYSIQANRTLFGLTWKTNEYLSNSEEEAIALCSRKNGWALNN